MSHEAAAALFDEAEGQASGFFLECSETEACRSGLGDYEAAVFEEQLTRLMECAF